MRQYMKLMNEGKFDKELSKRVAAYRKEHDVSERKARFMVLDDIFDDLPDGAYFAAMAEYGYEAEDIIELSEEHE